MSVNSSSFAGLSLLPPHLSSNVSLDSVYKCFTFRMSLFILSFSTTYILFLPLLFLVLYLGYQQWKKQRSSSSYWDSITYHSIAMQLNEFLAVILFICGHYIKLPEMMPVALCVWSLCSLGQALFQLLTCVIRYLAVVHPITYIGLRRADRVWIRNISIGISVLYALKRPGLGEVGGTRKHVDQSKQSAFHSIVAIMGMEPVLCYESRNSSCPKTIYPLPIRITLYMILGGTVILTVCGNLLVAVSIAYFKQLHTPTNYLIVSLAVSDLLLGLFVMMPSMIQCVESCWYFGDDFYRHYAVCQPLLYRRKISVNVVLIMILLSWSISALIGFGMIFLKLNIWGIEDFYYNHIACEGRCVLFQSGLSSTVSSVISFYIPGIIMLGVYLKILLVAQRQSRSIQKTSCMNSTRISNTTQTKATKTLAIIMGAFLSFWTPFFVCNTIDPFVDYSTPPALFDTLVWVGYFNSTVNPIIYAFYYSWFRKAFRLFTSGVIFKSDISETILVTE
ncbi:trace amine-associated receptor 1-like [Sparus aurata]|uniref:trace amine-associated receptor 1-like n=1 Tax=Sparus aurata TaxID=8175 RepID=UPI0011C0D861|nr:trace amine-associated receptor 1-like [Sparus aurata]